MIFSARARVIVAAPVRWVASLCHIWAVEQPVAAHSKAPVDILPGVDHLGADCSAQDRPARGNKAAVRQNIAADKVVWSDRPVLLRQSHSQD